MNPNSRSIDDMSDMDLEEELKRRRARASQHASSGMTTNTTENNPTGIANPADFRSVFVNRANEDTRDVYDLDGNKTGTESRNFGSTLEKELDKLPPDAQSYFWSKLEELAGSGRDLNKHDLRALEHDIKSKFGIRKFDISSGPGYHDVTMAAHLNSIRGKYTPAKREEAKPTAQEAKGPTTNDQLNAAFKRIKNKQASDADLALFKNYSEAQLKKMGFGPISIDAIKNDSQTRHTIDIDKDTIRGTDEDVEHDRKYGLLPKKNYTLDDAAGHTKEELDAMHKEGMSDDIYNQAVSYLAPSTFGTTIVLPPGSQYDKYRKNNRKGPAGGNGLGQNPVSDEEIMQKSGGRVNPAVLQAKAMDQYYAHH